MSAQMGFDDVFDDRAILWRWEVPTDMYTAEEMLVGDIASEYVVVSIDTGAGVMLWARRDDGSWFANPSGRAVVARLLEEQRLDLKDVDRFRGMARRHEDERDEARELVRRCEAMLNKWPVPDKFVDEAIALIDELRGQKP